MKKKRAPTISVTAVIAYHQQQIERAERAIQRARQWSEENNDGDPELAGTYYTGYLPRAIETHERCIRHFKRIK